MSFSAQDSVTQFHILFTFLKKLVVCAVVLENHPEVRTSQNWFTSCVPCTPLNQRRSSSRKAWSQLGLQSECHTSRPKQRSLRPHWRKPRDWYLQLHHNRRLYTTGVYRHVHWSVRWGIHACKLVWIYMCANGYPTVWSTTILLFRGFDLIIRLCVFEFATVDAPNVSTCMLIPLGRRSTMAASSAAR